MLEWYLQIKQGTRLTEILLSNFVLTKLWRNQEGKRLNHMSHPYQIVKFIQTNEQLPLSLNGEIFLRNHKAAIEIWTQASGRVT